ncbi:hypothetical protein NIB75_10970 [Bacteroides uniformis]|nr:hypothetical protein [Bacteroides uniformis]
MFFIITIVSKLKTPILAVTKMMTIEATTPMLPDSSSDLKSRQAFSIDETE